MAAPPTWLFAQYAVSGVSPSGERHLDHERNGFVKALGTGHNEYLNFGAVNNSELKQHTPTYAIVGRIIGSGDAREAVYNLRFWIPDYSVFTNGAYWFNGLASGQWIQDLELTDASGYYVPTELPSGQNIWRDAGGTFDRNDLSFQEITGSGLDSQVTMFQYVSMTVDTDVPVATYGGNGGGFTYRLTYDYR